MGRDTPRMSAESCFRRRIRNLLLVLAMAVPLVFTVLLVELRSFAEPVAIVTGALLAPFGTVLALWITGTSLNVVSFLGAIIGVGIVANNAILVLDLVEHLLEQAQSLEEALVRSGYRRLRPVLMTSMAAAFGMLQLAWGIGSGADMLRPLAIAIIGALCISVLLWLVATPTVFHVLVRRRHPAGAPPADPGAPARMLARERIWLRSWRVQANGWRMSWGR